MYTPNSIFNELIVTYGYAVAKGTLGISNMYVRGILKSQILMIIRKQPLVMMLSTVILKTLNS
ncbi:MAG: hypothetical protein ACI9TV_000554 [Sulfurimonas sp.]|jgi:hypothetical protein